MIGLNLYNALMHFFVPPFCNYCRTFLTEKTVFCTACTENIKPLVSTKLSINKKWHVQVFALSHYQDPVKRLILAKSWSHRLASVQMADLLWHRTILPTLDFDCLIPIPLHWTRKAWRGYNQAEIIAECLGNYSAKPMYQLLIRKKRTKFQSQLGIKERSKNVQNAFMISTNKHNLIYNKHIILVDDLMTTGSTLQEAAKSIIPLKPSTISAIVTCRVI